VTATLIVWHAERVVPDLIEISRILVLSRLELLLLVLVVVDMTIKPFA
jgi:hypothetical protein